jgi:hypothetical protein
MIAMTPPRTVEVTPHTFIGVSLALLGVVLTLDNLGFVDARAVWRFWPLVPMLVGVVYIVQGRETREWLLGTGWLAVGTAFLLRNLEVFHFQLADFLPLLLVALGLKVIFGRRTRGRGRGQWSAGGGATPASTGPGPVGESAFAPRFEPAATGLGGAASAAPGTAGAGPRGSLGQVIRVFAVLWGADRRARGPVSHVEVSAVMGGCDVDLREAAPTRDTIVIQVFAMWGGIDIRVPPGWMVEIEAWPILGGVVDTTQAPALPTHRVVVRGMAFMGGVEIKN